MIRKKFLLDLGGYDESFTCQDGYELWIKFISFHKVSNINRPLFSYRQHELSLSTNQTNLLRTRKLIKEKFVKTYLKPLKTLFVIPVREKKYNSILWPDFKFSGKTVLEHKVETLLGSTSVSKVVITTDNESLFESYSLLFEQNTNVEVIKRSKEFASLRTSINKTLLFVLETINEDFDAIGLASLDYPLIDTSVIDETINTLNIFNSDSVLSVVGGQGPFYRHNGQSLKAILNQDKYTSLEREYLFTGSGGLALAKMDCFLSSGLLIGNRVAHVLLDHHHAFGVFNEFDFDIFIKYITYDNQ